MTEDQKKIMSRIFNRDLAIATGAARDIQGQLDQVQSRAKAMRASLDLFLGEIRAIEALAGQAGIALQPYDQPVFDGIALTDGADDAA